MNSFRSLTKAMFLGFRRDGRALFFAVLLPLIFLVIFAGVFGGQTSGKVKIIQVGHIAVLEQATTNPELHKVITLSTATDHAAAVKKVKDGDVALAVEQSGDGKLQLFYSGADQVSAGGAQSIVQEIVTQANVQASPVPQKYQIVGASQVEDKSLKAIQFFTPSLLGWALASAGIFATSQTLVQWRTTGLLRRLRLSPAPIASVFGARVMVSVLVALLQMAAFLLVASLPFFGLKLPGQWWLAIPMLICGVLAFLSMGMVIGAWAKTLDSAQAMTQIIVLPMAFLGGSFFPLDNAPGWYQGISYVMPLRYLNTGMTNVIARGEGIGSALPYMGILLAIAAVFAGIGFWLFRWDND